MNNEIALVGNPNCGKTTLFNVLTGTYQKVGNWTGVTIDKKQGVYKKDKTIKIVDLPGLYSLRSTAIDEKLSIDYLLKSPPKLIINVVDGTNLERNLLLTLELLTLKIPVVVAVNFFDQLEVNNIKLNVKELSSILNLPVIPISALKNKNLDLLMDLAKSHSLIPKTPDLTTFIGQTLTQKRFLYIESIIDRVISKKQTKAEKITQNIDKIILSKHLGIPIFFLVMTLVYFLSNKIGGFFGGYFVAFFDNVKYSTAKFLQEKCVSQWLISLCCDAIISSIGGITSFLPQILILFALLAIIEESGYSSRIAFLLDRFFRSFGLSGKSILPLTVSCGCTVTGLMATRTIERIDERKMTIFLVPFMPCGAKTAVFAWFSHAFFNGNALVSASLYFLGIICVGVFGRLLKKFKAFNTDEGSFLMEMPVLRTPSIKDVFFVLKEKVKEFVTKAGLIVFAVSVFLWLLKSVGTSGYVGDNIERSFLFSVGNALKYIFYPIGVKGWEASVALIAGAFAKEAVVESLNLLSNDINTIFSAKYSVYAFMAFILLSPPCVASLATAKQELGGFKPFILMVVFQFFVAYAVALLINSIGFVICNFLGLLLSIIIAIIILIITIFAIKKLKKCNCTDCGGCKKGRNKCQKARHFTI